MSEAQTQPQMNVTFTDNAKAYLELLQQMTHDGYHLELKMVKGTSEVVFTAILDNDALRMNGKQLENHFTYKQMKVHQSFGKFTTHEIKVPMSDLFQFADGINDKSCRITISDVRQRPLEFFLEGLRASMIHYFSTQDYAGIRVDDDDSITS